MDSFTLLIGILLVFLEFQLQQNWLVFLTVIILIITLHSLIASVLLIAVSVFLYFFAAGGSLKEFFLPILVVLIVVAVISALKSKPEQPEMFSQDLYGSYGGGEFGGGGGGLGGF